MDLSWKLSLKERERKEGRGRDGLLELRAVWAKGGRMDHEDGGGRTDTTGKEVEEK